MLSSVLKHVALAVTDMMGVGLQDLRRHPKVGRANMIGGFSVRVGSVESGTVSFVGANNEIQPTGAFEVNVGSEADHEVTVEQTGRVLKCTNIPPVIIVANKLRGQWAE